MATSQNQLRITHHWEKGEMGKIDGPRDGMHAKPFLGADEWIEEEIKNGNKPKPVEKPSPKKEKK